MWKLLFSLLLLLTSCGRQMLHVDKFYITRHQLASSRTLTPDPRKFYPTQGEEYVVNWAFPDQYMEWDDLTIRFTVRFQNHEEDSEEFPVTRRVGSLSYYHLNDNYYCQGSVVTYKVELLSCGYQVDSWCHPLWFELITFDE